MNKIVRTILPIGFLLAGLTLMIVGVMRGELQEVFRKAIIVCLECIGIG